MGNTITWYEYGGGFTMFCFFSSWGGWLTSQLGQKRVVCRHCHKRRAYKFSPRVRDDKIFWFGGDGGSLETTVIHFEVFALGPTRNSHH